MLIKLFCIIFSFMILILFSPHHIFASQKIHTQTNASFFTFFENYIFAFNAIDTYNKQVLAAETQATPTPTPTQPAQLTPPTSTQTIPSLSEVSAYILKGVNEYRASLGLSPVQSSPQTCAFATTRAQEIASGFNHDGFYNRVNKHTLPYDSWSHAVENIAQAPDYKEVVTLWKNSPGHAANMRDNTPYVCIQQYQSYYAYEGMRP